MRRLVSLWLLVIAGVARGEDLATFLAAASEAARVPVAVRADGELTYQGLDGTSKDSVTLLRNPAGDTFIELRQAGLRVLVPSRGDKAYQRPKGAARATPLPFEASIPGTDFCAEDLRPFDIARYGSPIIADRNERQTTVSLDPHDSHYTLVVITFDREAKVPVKTMYYTDTLNNLVKMKLEGERDTVAGRSLPGEVSMEAFKLKTATALRLTWREAPDLAASYFDPEAFAAAPALPPPDAQRQAP